LTDHSGIPSGAQFDCVYQHSVRMDEPWRMLVTSIENDIGLFTPPAAGTDFTYDKLSAWLLMDLYGDGTIVNGAYRFDGSVVYELRWDLLESLPRAADRVLWRRGRWAQP